MTVPSREALKVNVFERIISSNTNPQPLFPYFGPGAILIAGAVNTGGPAGLGTTRGVFHHRNSQHEINVLYGTAGTPFTPGRFSVNEETHGNSGYFGEDDPPEHMVVLTLTQRQRDADDEGTQREAIQFRCPDCDTVLLDFDYDAEPGERPRHDEPAGAADDHFPLFPTVWGSATAAIRFCGTQAQRTCPECGRIADIYPHDAWGWARYVRHNHAANAARRSLLSAALSDAHQGENS